MEAKARRYFSALKDSHSAARIRTVFLASSVLLGLSFIVHGFEWLTFVSLLGWFYYVDNLVYLKKRQVLLDFYAAGFIVNGFAFYFLLQAAPQNWNVSLHGWFAIAAQVISWLLICSFCALSGLIFGLLLYRLRHSPFRILVFALLIPCIEFVRSYLFTIMSYGPDGSFMPNFNMGTLAVSASGTALVFASRLVGFFGLSLLAAVLVMGCYCLFKRQFIVATGTILTVFLVSFLGYHMYHPAQVAGKQKVAVVHLNEQDSMENWRDFSEVPSNTDLLVLPEYSGALDSPNFKELAQKMSPSGLGVTTVATGRPPKATNQLTFFNSKGQIINTQDKTLLIPTGEYLPYSLSASFTLLRQQKNITNFTYTQKLTSGNAPIHPVGSGDMTVGALACSGIVSLKDYARLTDQGANVLANTASLAFLQSNSRYHVFAQNMARFQSVFNSRTFAQASRSGESFVIDGQGNFLTKSQGQASQTKSVTLEL